MITGVYSGRSSRPEEVQSSDLQLCEKDGRVDDSLALLCLERVNLVLGLLFFFVIVLESYFYLMNIVS